MTKTKKDTYDGHKRSVKFLTLSTLTTTVRTIQSNFCRKVVGPLSPWQTWLCVIDDNLWTNNLYIKVRLWFYTGRLLSMYSNESWCSGITCSEFGIELSQWWINVWQWNILCHRKFQKHKSDMRGGEPWQEGRFPIVGSPGLLSTNFRCWN